MATASSIPYIDPNVEHVGVSHLRKLNATNLRSQEKALVIQDNETPLAVLLTYEQYLIIQQQLRSIVDTIEVLTDESESAALNAGLKDVRAGRITPLSEIRAALNRKGRKIKTPDDD